MPGYTNFAESFIRDRWQEIPHECMFEKVRTVRHPFRGAYFQCTLCWERQWDNHDQFLSARTFEPEMLVIQEEPEEPEWLKSKSEPLTR